MKVLLVLPPKSRRVLPPQPDEGWWMPLGLLSVGTFLLSQMPDIELEILDGEVSNYSQIENSIQSDADIVGFSPNVRNYELTLELAEAAKEQGATIVFGGHHATAIAEQILHHQSFVDFVVRGDGEIAFAEIVKKTEPSQIANLSYRERHQVVHNPIDWLHLDRQIPDINYDLINPVVYWDNHSHNYPLSKDCPYRKPLTIVSQRGCLWREKTGGCIFCSRMEPAWRGRDAQRIWKEVAYWNRHWGVDSIVDVSDDFLTNPEWFKEFYKNRLADIDVRYIYARPDRITPETVTQLKELETWTVFLGTESGNEVCLHTCRKGFSARRQIEAVQLLADHGIHCSISFVLGLPAETQESLQDTYEHIQCLLDVGTVDLLFVNILNPTPGSPAWHLLLNLREGKQFTQTDTLRMEDIQRTWIKNFCWVDYEELVETQERMLALKPNSVAEYKT